MDNQSQKLERTYTVFLSYNSEDSEDITILV